MKHLNRSKVVFGGMIAIALLATGSFAFADETKGGVSAATSRGSAGSGTKAVAKATVRTGSTVNAADVSAGTFGASVGGGDYAFPHALGIGAAPESGYELDINNGDERFTVGLLEEGNFTYATLTGLTPAYKIHDTNTDIYGYFGSAGWSNRVDLGATTLLNIYSDAADVIITSGGGNGVRIASTTGNFGVGTNAPAYKLDVAGMIRSSSGGFRFPDGTVQTTAANNRLIDMVSASMPERSACTMERAGRFALDTTAQKLYVCLGSQWAAVQLEK